MSPRAVVTGGAGFLGSHFCRALMAQQWDVLAIDNLHTGSRENVSDLEATASFELLVADVTVGLEVDGPVDAVLHLASPASPADYLAHPIETLRVGSLGTENTLGLALAKEARYLLASTSEVYGDPEISPQPETYWGHVNPVGPRSVYDEAKRFAEAMTMAIHRVHGLDVKIARIFNTYGPGLRPGDGRVVSNFLTQAISGEPVTVYGDGSQTRSFCYVDDLVRGLIALLESDWTGPMNLGNPTEVTVLELARRVIEITGSSPVVSFDALPIDDPRQRRPDIELARRELGWEPLVGLDEGLMRTRDWYVGEEALGGRQA